MISIDWDQGLRRFLDRSWTRIPLMEFDITCKPLCFLCQGDGSVVHLQEQINKKTGETRVIQVGDPILCPQCSGAGIGKNAS